MYMDNENPVVEQAKEAVDCALEEKFVTEDSSDVGRVKDVEYAKLLAQQEDDTRSTGYMSPEAVRYAENITDKKIIKDTTEEASRILSHNEDDKYKDAKESLTKTGLTPVTESMSREKLIQLSNLADVEAERRTN